MNIDKSEIMRIIYIKLMRLKTTFYPIYSIMRNPAFDWELPDIRTGLINTYTIDFITTINGIFTSGKYSFEFLKKEESLVEKYTIIKNRISSEYGISKIRNSQICHFTDKVNPSVINKMFVKSPHIIDEIIEFYDMACKKLNIDVSLFGYTRKKWESFHEEVDLFEEIIHSCDDKLIMMNVERNMKKTKKN